MNEDTFADIQRLAASLEDTAGLLHQFIARQDTYLDRTPQLQDAVHRLRHTIVAVTEELRTV